MKIHKEIWLQVDPDGDRYDEGYEDVTWCKDRINDSDVCYVLASEAEKLRAELESVKAENVKLREDAERYEWLRKTKGSADYAICQYSNDSGDPHDWYALGYADAAFDAAIDTARKTKP